MDNSGAIIKALRENSGMKATELATRLGITQAYVSLLEQGKRKLSPDLAKKISEIFNVQWEALYGSEMSDLLMLSTSQHKTYDIKDEYGIKIGRAIRAMRGNVSVEFAAANAGVSPDFWVAIETGNIKLAARADLDRMTAVFGLHVEDILDEDFKLTADQIVYKTMPLRVKVVPRKFAASLHDTNELPTRNHEYEQHLYTIENFDPVEYGPLYGVYVISDNMSPDMQRNDLVIFAETLPADKMYLDGTTVMLMYNGRMMARVLYNVDGNIRFHAWNADYEDFSPPQDSYKVLGKVLCILPEPRLPKPGR